MLPNPPYVASLVPRLCQLVLWVVTGHDRTCQMCKRLCQRLIAARTLQTEMCRFAKRQEQCGASDETCQAVSGDGMARSGARNAGRDAEYLELLHPLLPWLVAARCTIPVARSGGSDEAFQTNLNRSGKSGNDSHQW